MSKCKGCGLTLQNKDKSALGYSPKLTNKLCERCFKITNYNYHDDGKSIDNNTICSMINKKKAFNFFLCDIFSLNDSNIQLFTKINNPKALVITKVDLLPANVDYKTFIERVKKAYNIENVLLTSIKNDVGLDDILKYTKVYTRVLFCGPTSSGKSSIINYLFDFELTTSAFKNTTQEFINLKWDNCAIIDAPGFMSDILTKKAKMISPRTLNIKKDYELVIDNMSFLFKNSCSITLFLPAYIEVKTRKIRNELSSYIDVPDAYDLTVKNIGFIYFKKGCRVYVNDSEHLSLRSSVVGSYEQD